jgi:hypothetical protein
MIKLYHYSNRDFKGYIRPDFFGLNSYSRNSRRISQVKKSYYYIDPARIEYYFGGCKYIYITQIDPARLYDLTKDPLKLGGKVKDIYQAIKNRGYIGAIGNNGVGCVVLFRPARIKDRLTRGIND